MLLGYCMYHYGNCYSINYSRRRQQSVINQRGTTYSVPVIQRLKLAPTLAMLQPLPRLLRNKVACGGVERVNLKNQLLPKRKHPKKEE